MTTLLGKRVVVSNPALPCLTNISEQLADAGVIRTYYTPVGTNGDTAAPRILPRRVRLRLDRELQRRRLTESFERTAVEHPALPAELLFVALRRSGLAAQRPALRLRNAWFDRAVASRLQREDAAVLSVYTASERTIARARSLSIPSLLYSPIAHHRFAERLLGDEAKLTPSFAATLSYHRFPEWRVRQLEDELDRADAVVVLSSFQRRTFVESGIDPRRIHVVNLGVDLDLFRPTPRREDGIFRVIFSGQLTQRKGLSYLLDAFEQAELPSSELLLVGGPVGDALEHIRRTNVRHVPHVPRRQLPDLYATADAYVLPSLLEGFAQTPLEAMACGLPPIVSENTFDDDVIEDGVNGFVVPIRDVDAIAERLRALYDDPSLRVRMGAAARKRAEDFSWHRSGERMLDVIDRVVAGSSPIPVPDSAPRALVADG